MCSDHNDLGLADKNAMDAGGCCGGGACMCGHGGAAEAASTTEVSSGTDFFVTGMTCGHCVSSVTEELSALDGVQSVSVQLDAAGASRVTVAADRALDVDAVRAAIDEAGYSLVDQV